MADIDFKKIGSDMLTAMKASVEDNFMAVKEIADDELEDFVKRTTTLAEKVANGTISELQARAILKIRQNALETVLLSIAGISLLAAQEAINAAIGVLRKVINDAIPGIDIL
jgi:hypothetical protein